MPMRGRKRATQGQTRTRRQQGGGRTGVGRTGTAATAKQQSMVSKMATPSKTPAPKPSMPPVRPGIYPPTTTQQPQQSAWQQPSQDEELRHLRSEEEAASQLRSQAEGDQLTSESNTDGGHLTSGSDTEGESGREGT